MMKRRNFLEMLAKAACAVPAAAAAPVVAVLFPAEAFAEDTLAVQYMHRNGETCLKIRAGKGESPASVARLYTGNESNYPAIRKLSNAPRGFTEGQAVYVPKRLLRHELVDVLNANEFETVFIDADDIHANSLYDIAKKYTDYAALAPGKAGVMRMVDLLLMLNQDISPRKPVVRNGQPILIPRGSLDEKMRDALPDTKLPAPRPPKKPAEKTRTETTGKQDEDDLIAEYARYQNPLRIQDVSARIKPWGDYGAGRRGRYRTRRFNPHPAVDIVARVGTPLYPMMVGRVIYAGQEKDRRPQYWRNGNVVEIEAPNGVRTFYAHLQKVSVKSGQYVGLTMLIGTVGITGNGGAAPEPHVHVQVRKNGVILDPRPFLKPGARYQDPKRYISEFREIARKAN